MAKKIWLMRKGGGFREIVSRKPYLKLGGRYVLTGRNKQIASGFPHNSEVQVEIVPDIRTVKQKTGRVKVPPRKVNKILQAKFRR